MLAVDRKKALSDLVSRLTVGYAETQNIASPSSEPTTLLLSTNEIPKKIKRNHKAERTFLQSTQNIFHTSTSPEETTKSILQRVKEYTKAGEIFFIRSNVNRIVLDGAYTKEKTWSILESTRLSQVHLFSQQILLHSRCSEAPVILSTNSDVKNAGSDFYVDTLPESVLCVPIFVHSKFIAALYLTNDSPGAFKKIQTSLLNLVISNLTGILNQQTLTDWVKTKRTQTKDTTSDIENRNALFNETMLLYSELSGEWKSHVASVTEDELKFFSSIDSSPNTIILLKDVEKVMILSNLSKEQRTILKLNEILIPKKPKTKPHMILIESKGDRITWLSLKSSKSVQIWNRILTSKSPTKFSRITSLDIPPNVRINPSDVAVGRIIGRGATSCVFKGKWNETPVAIKKFHDSLGEADIHAFFREIELLHTLRHPNIVSLMGGFAVDGVPSIVTELVERGSLDTVLHKNAVNISGVIKLQIIKQIANALCYLHTRTPPIIHRDIKPGNILVAENWTVKLIDFGLARKRSSNLTNGQGTVRWMAPEVLKNEQYSEKADIYSFGLVMWEIIEQDHFFTDLKFNSQIEMQVVQENKRPPFSSKFSPDIKKIISQCWSGDPNTRPKAADILDFLKHMKKC